MQSIQNNIMLNTGHLTNNLNKSQFFKNLSTPIQEQLAHVLEQDMDKFNKFDEDKGYAVMEDDDSFMEALN